MRDPKLFYREPRNKYRAKKVTVDGETFDSQGEYARWCELKLLERAGKISGLKRQITYPLVVNGEKIGSIIPDFDYRDNRTGEQITEDFKSKPTQTPVFRLKAKLFKAVYGREIKLSGPAAKARVA